MSLDKPIVRRVASAAGAVAAAVLLASAGTARAAYFKSYDANAATPAPDPTSPAGGGWGLTGLTPANVTKAPGSDATGNYWQVTDTNTNPSTGAAQNNSAGYIVQLSGAGADANLSGAFTDPNGWQFSVTLKLLDGRVAGAAAGTDPLFFDIRTDPDGVAPSVGRIFTLGLFQNDPAVANGVWWTPNGANLTGGSLIHGMDLNDGFHTIDMILDKDPDNAANNTFKVLIDGTERFSILESAANISGVSRVQTAQSASGATHDVQYRSFTFQTIPEPGAGALLGAAAIAGLAGGRRRRR